MPKGLDVLQESSKKPQDFLTVKSGTIVLSVNFTGRGPVGCKKRQHCPENSGNRHSKSITKESLSFLNLFPKKTKTTKKSVGFQNPKTTKKSVGFQFSLPKAKRPGNVQETTSAIGSTMSLQARRSRFHTATSGECNRHRGRFVGETQRLEYDEGGVW